ncbi:MAG TPA: hypothetical protein EYP14_18665 [Planctomycetaceae bacterium]|nr:hypothetical protein [Planctomycetaceae bacterium]
MISQWTMAIVASHSVPGWVTGLFGLLLGAMIAALAFEEKLHARKSIIVGLFTAGCLMIGTLLHLLSFGEIRLPDGHSLELPVYHSRDRLGRHHDHPRCHSFCESDQPIGRLHLDGHQADPPIGWRFAVGAMPLDGPCGGTRSRSGVSVPQPIA